MDNRAVVRRLLGLTASIGLAGCAVSDPTQFYTLGQAAAGSPIAENVERTASASASRSRVAATGAVGIGVGPVLLPGYLDRSQIVIRTGADRVELSMFHRWAEPLADGVARTLTEEIGARVPTDRIVTFPWRSVVARVIRYQVVVEVLRFDGRPGGDVTLDTRWRILGRDDDELAFRRSTIVEAATGSGYEPIVAAMARALGTLGGEIAAEIRTLPEGSRR
jgi:uncharacterized protein